ncbi:hypothetical protein ACFL1R_12305 [Candidatus Latescibacterota bacterium]
MILPHLLIILFVIFSVLSGCSPPTEFERDHPLDPDSNNFVSPAVSSINVNNNQVFNTRVVNVTWQGNSTAYWYQYTLDGSKSGWTTNKSASFSDLNEDKKYTFSISAKNQIGYIGSPTTRTFTVDLDAPIITSINLEDEMVVDSRIVTISWNSNYTALDFQYTLDGVEYEAITDSTVTFTGLDEGEHTFSIMPRNDRQEPGIATTRTFTVDLDAPIITSINLEDEMVVDSRIVTISWNSNYTALDFQYTLDGVEYEAITDSTVTFTGLDEGEHTFSIMPRNDRQEPGIATTRTFTVDVVQVGVLFSKGYVSSSDTELDLILEGVSSLMSAHIEIVATNNCAKFTGFTINEEEAGDGQFAVYTNTDDSSRLIIDIAFLGGSEGLTGLIEIGSIQLNILSNGKLYTDSNNTIFRSVNNEDILLQGHDEITVVYQ